MNGNEVSATGRVLWRRLVGAEDGWSRGMRQQLPNLSDEDVRLLGAELLNLWSELRSEQERRSLVGGG